MNFQPNFYQRFQNCAKFGSKEKRLHHMVEQKTYWHHYQDIFFPFFPSFQWPPQSKLLRNIRLMALLTSELCKSFYQPPLNGKCSQKFPIIGSIFQTNSHKFSIICVRGGPLGPGLGTPHVKSPSHMLIFLWCDVRDIHGKILHAHDQTLKPRHHHSHHQTLKPCKTSQYNCGNPPPNDNSLVAFTPFGL